MIALKVCFKCKEQKSLDYFYKHSKMTDGHLNKCKECTKDDVKQRRKQNTKVQEYDRLRGNRQSASYTKEYREKYPLKYKAHCIVNNAIRDGKIVPLKNCEHCGSEYSIHGHHCDYEKPLDITWLCSMCHSRWHSLHGESKPYNEKETI